MQKRSQQTRARILEAALQQFGGRGYAATSVDQICTRAGISKGAFYHHFASKQAVFLALLNDWLKTVDQGLESLHKPNVPRTLLTMGDILPGIISAADGRLPMFLEFWLQASRDSKVWRATIDPYRHYHAHFTRLVEQGIAEGTLRQVDADLAGRLILALAVGMLLQAILEPQQADWRHAARSGMQSLLKGLAK